VLERKQINVFFHPVSSTRFESSELMDFWTLLIVQYSKKLDNTAFQKLYLFLSLGGRGETPPSKGPNRVGVSLPHLRMETDPVSEMLYSVVFYEYWTMDEVQKPSNSECYTPSSEPFRIYGL
jgi:hypothetical protein